MWEPTAEVIQYWRARGYTAHRSTIAGSLILDPLRPPSAPTAEVIQYWRARGYTAHQSAIAGSLILDPIPGKEPQHDLVPASEVLGTVSGIVTGETGEPPTYSDLLGAAG